MITGGLPESGFRLVLERPRENDAVPCTYTGRIELPTASHAVVVEVDASLVVHVRLEAPEGPESAALGDKIRLLVRQVVKESTRDASPLARKIVRWRGEK